MPWEFGGFVNVSLRPLPPAPVPEPDTYAMLLAGLGILGFMARHRKQQAPQSDSAVINTDPASAGFVILRQHPPRCGCRVLSRARLSPGRPALALAQKVRFLCTLNMLQMCETKFKSTHKDREHANEKFD